MKVAVGTELRWLIGVTDLLKRMLEVLPRSGEVNLEIGSTDPRALVSLAASGDGLGVVTIAFSERRLGLHMVQAPGCVDLDKSFHMDLRLEDDGTEMILGVATAVFNLLVWGDLEAPSAVDRLAEIA